MCTCVIHECRTKSLLWIKSSKITHFQIYQSEQKIPKENTFQNHQPWLFFRKKQYTCIFKSLSVESIFREEMIDDIWEMVDDFPQNIHNCNLLSIFKNNSFSYLLGKLIFKFIGKTYFKVINYDFLKIRGSQEPVITHLVFNLTSKVDRKWGCYT